MFSKREAILTMTKCIRTFVHLVLVLNSLQAHDKKESSLREIPEYNEDSAVKSSL